MITGFIRGQRLMLAQTTVAGEEGYSTARFIFQTSDWLESGTVIYAHFRLNDAQSDYLVSDGVIPLSEELTLSEGTWEVWLTGHQYEGQELIQRLTTNIAALTVEATGFEPAEPLPVRSFGESILGVVQNIYEDVAEQIQGAATATDEQLDAQDAAIAAQLTEQNEAVAAQLEAQGEAVTTQLAAQDGAVTNQLSAQNTAITNQITAQNAAVTAQLEEQDAEFTRQLAAQDEAVDARLDENEAVIDAAFGGLKNWKDASWLKLWAGSEEDFEAVTPSADTIYLLDMGLTGGPAPNGGGDA